MWLVVKLGETMSQLTFVIQTMEGKEHTFLLNVPSGQLDRVLTKLTRSITRVTGTPEDHQLFMELYTDEKDSEFDYAPVERFTHLVHQVFAAGANQLKMHLVVDETRQRAGWAQARASCGNNLQQMEKHMERVLSDPRTWKDSDLASTALLFIDPDNFHNLPSHIIHNTRMMELWLLRNQHHLCGDFLSSLPAEFCDNDEWVLRVLMSDGYALNRASTRLQHSLPHIVEALSIDFCEHSVNQYLAEWDNEAMNAIYGPEGPLIKYAYVLRATNSLVGHFALVPPEFQTVDTLSRVVARYGEWAQAASWGEVFEGLLLNKSHDEMTIIIGSVCARYLRVLLHQNDAGDTDIDFERKRASFAHDWMCRTGWSL